MHLVRCDFHWRRAALEDTHFHYGGREVQGGWPLSNSAATGLLQTGLKPEVPVMFLDTSWYLLDSLIAVRSWTSHSVVSEITYAFETLGGRADLRCSELRCCGVSHLSTTVVVAAPLPGQLPAAVPGKAESTAHVFSSCQWLPRCRWRLGLSASSSAKCELCGLFGNEPTDERYFSISLYFSLSGSSK